MAKPSSKRESDLTVQSLVKQVLTARRITRKEYLQMVSTLLADPELSDEERRQINRIFDYIQINQVTIVDW